MQPMLSKEIVSLTDSVWAAIEKSVAVKCSWANVSIHNSVSLLIIICNQLCFKIEKVSHYYWMTRLQSNHRDTFYGPQGHSYNLHSTGLNLYIYIYIIYCCYIYSEGLGAWCVHKRTHTWATEQQKGAGKM